MTTADDVVPVRTEGMGVRYGRREIFAGVSLSVPRGSVYALLGRNGAGKSSLIRCLLGHQKVSGGRALLFGRDAWKGRAEVMQRVGFVPETPDAPVEMTVERLLTFCSSLHPRFERQQAADRLSTFEVPKAVPFGALSRGQRGAVMLALALATNPELLILDDPTLGLDVVARGWFFGELVSDLAQRGTTVFITTHDLAAIEGLADRVGILAGGRLALEEEMETLRARYRKPVARVNGGELQEETMTLEEIFTTVAAGSPGAAR
jgi:ABC-2 type transport system ATP-binding protein